MHHENELTREKTTEDVEGNQPTPPECEVEGSPSTQSESDSDSNPSINDGNLVTFRPGEPADPYNWSKVSHTSSAPNSRVVRHAPRQSIRPSGHVHSTNL